MTIQEMKYMALGFFLVFCVVMIAYLLAYFNIHLPFPPNTPTPIP